MGKSLHLSGILLSSASKGDINTYLRGGGKDQGGDGPNAPLLKLPSSGKGEGWARPAAAAAAGGGARQTGHALGASAVPRAVDPPGSEPARTGWRGSGSSRQGARRAGARLEPRARAGLRLSAGSGRVLPPVPAPHIRGPWPGFGLAACG